MYSIVVLYLLVYFIVTKQIGFIILMLLFMTPDN